MNEQIKNEKDINFLERPVTSPDHPWELNAEDQNFFDRKIKALAYFKEKLDNTKDQSSKTSQEALDNLTRRIDALDVRANPEEIKTIIGRLNNLEKQKQEIIKSGESQIRDVAEAEHVNFEEVETKDNLKIQKQPDVTENNKPKNEKLETEINIQNEESTETSKEKPLEPGDEIFVNGKFYKVYSIDSGLNKKEIHNDYIRKRQMGQITYAGQSEIEYIAEKEKEFKGKGIVPPRKIQVLLEGSDALEEFDEDKITRVTSPEQREKFKTMQQDLEKGEQKAADYMGIGAVQKAVHKLTSQE